MFTLITVTADAWFFFRAGEVREVCSDAPADEVLRIARDRAKNPAYKAVGIRVGNRHNSPVLWVK